MKRRDFLRGAAAAPAALTLPDLLAGLVAQDPAPAAVVQGASEPPMSAVRMTRTRMFINDIELDGVRSVRMEGSVMSSAINTTSLDDCVMSWSEPDYNTIEFEALTVTNMQLWDLMVNHELCRVRLQLGDQLEDDDAPVEMAFDAYFCDMRHNAAYYTEATTEFRMRIASTAVAS